MDEEPKAALLERHAPILEEVAAELDLSGEFDTTEQAEQVCAAVEYLLGLRASNLSPFDVTYLTE